MFCGARQFKFYEKFYTNNYKNKPFFGNFEQKWKSGTIFALMSSETCVKTIHTFYKVLGKRKFVLK